MSADTYYRMSIQNQWVERIQNLPVLPQVAMRITERMQSPTATLQEISDLIKSDVGLTSKILKLANSSYYSIPGGVSDVLKALQYLGFNTIAQIVLTTSVFGSFRASGIREFPLSGFWQHSFAVGLVAELTARNLQYKNPSDCFIGGLMHDVGKLILLELAPDQLSKIVKHAAEEKISFLKAETSLQLVPHTELGVKLAEHWRLPASVVSLIRSHHGGGTKPEEILIEWANVWVHTQKIGNSGNFQSDLTAEHDELMKKAGLTPSQVKQIEIHFAKEFEKAGALLSGS